VTVPAEPAGASLEAVRAAVAAIADPEVPVLTIEDLGVLRSVDREAGRIVVTITPTYSGCPAMQHIEQEVVRVLSEAEAGGEVRTVLSPAWTTDWLTEAGRRKLRAYGIAPPSGLAAHASPGGAGARAEAGVAVAIRQPVPCPQCGSTSTEVVSEFGSTACKALYRCRDCREPFDYFKEL
jgi:ring-1,2-phenylacetyl-CoA epoxidase subunit PaaD